MASIDPQAEIDLQPHLVGDLVELRPLRPDDWASLFRVASDPSIWDQHPAYDRYQEAVFRNFFSDALECGGALLILDRKTQEVIGSSRYHNHDLARRQLHIGFTFLACSRWGGNCNGELKRLMLEHAFQFVDTVIFEVGTTNFRSRRALEKIGAVMTGERNIANLNGREVEHLVYHIARPR